MAKTKATSERKSHAQMQEIWERAHYAACFAVALERAEDECTSWTNPENVNHPRHSVQQRYALRRALLAEIDGIMVASDPECAALLGGVQHG